MEAYRNTLTTSFFFKFYLRVLQSLHEQGVGQGLRSRALAQCDAWVFFADSEDEERFDAAQPERATRVCKGVNESVAILQFG
jgi:hypothetical protein